MRLLLSASERYAASPMGHFYCKNSFVWVQAASLLVGAVIIFPDHAT